MWIDLKEELRDLFSDCRRIDIDRGRSVEDADKVSSVRVRPMRKVFLTLRDHSDADRYLEASEEERVAIGVKAIERHRLVIQMRALEFGYLAIRRKRGRIPNSEAVVDVDRLKMLARRGFSLREIERITGVGRSRVARLTNQCDPKVVVDRAARKSELKKQWVAQNREKVRVFQREYYWRKKARNVSRETLAASEKE